MIKAVIVLVISCIYLLLSKTLYSSKNKNISTDNKVYIHMLVLTFIGIVLEIAYIFLIIFKANTIFISDIISKGFYIYLLTWVFLFIKSLSKMLFNNKIPIKIKTKRNLFNIVLIIIYLVFGISLLTLCNGSHSYSYGIATDLLYIVNYVTISIWIICLSLNYEQTGYKRFIPLFTFILGAVLNLIVRDFNMGVLLIIISQSFITIVIYYMLKNSNFTTNAQKDNVNRVKSDFLSSMSHEIRTPLNAIVGFSEDLQSHCNPNDLQLFEDASYIMEASQTLLEIIGNILDINQIENNEIKRSKVCYNLKSELKDIINSNRSKIGKKPLSLRVNYDSNIPYELIGDIDWIKKIVNNLLSNAVKYTDSGSIDLSIKCINNNDISNLRISVRDTGRGIKTEYLSKLFTKFERLDVPMNSTIEGVGLGLAITKRLVEMMGGNISVQSQIDLGSIFVVNLPQKISKLTNPVLNSTNYIKETCNLESIVKSIKLKTASSSISNNTVNKYINSKILIVDDNKLNIKVARRALQEFNFQIDECYDGEECLQMIKNGNEYSLILMDIMMPNMSGDVTLSKLKENPNFKIPTIALTADAVDGAKEKYINEGFVDYLAKPFSKDQIKEKIESYVL